MPEQEQITFEAELKTLINKHSLENGSNTPDYILATYLLGCLSIYNEALHLREAWYGRPIPDEPLETIMKEL